MNVSERIFRIESVVLEIHTSPPYNIRDIHTSPYNISVVVCFRFYLHNIFGGRSEERKVLGSVAGDEECTDDVSSGAGAASPASPREDDAAPAATHLWPSMQDLNTRLRRLITAYQRNYKREELKLQQRAKVCAVLGGLFSLSRIDFEAFLSNINTVVLITSD